MPPLFITLPLRYAANNIIDATLMLYLPACLCLLPELPDISFASAFTRRPNGDIDICAALIAVTTPAITPMSPPMPAPIFAMPAIFAIGIQESFAGHAAMMLAYADARVARAPDAREQARVTR